MENELFRIASFSKLPDTGQLGTISGPIYLARNGFYYSGVGYRVTCYKCNSQIDCSTLNDSVIETHKRLSPGCQLVIGNRQDDATAIGTINLGSLGLTTTNTPNRIEPGFQQLNQIYSSAVSRVTTGSPYVPDSQQQIDRSNPDFMKLRDEEVRLSTFFDWPQSAPINPQYLAQEGFFYTGIEDRVQCVFCFGYVINWKPTDIPSIEHKKHYPGCPFVRGLDVGNIRKTKENLPEARSKWDNSAYGTSLPDSLNPQFKSLSIQQPSLVKENARPLVDANNQDSPKYPEFFNLPSRIESYKDKIVPRGQTPRVLAEAGFFHIGPGDKVMCYHCGGNLKDWEAKDDPWDEHKKWYPTCNHLKTRGASNSLTPESSAPLRTLAALGSFPIETREIKARMDTPMVRAILNMGFDKDLIIKAIETRLKTKGDDFPNAQTLLDAIFELADEAMPQASTSSSSPHSTEAVLMAESRSNVMQHGLANTSSTIQRLEAMAVSSSRSSAQSDRSVYFADSRSLPPPQTGASSSASAPAQFALPAVRALTPVGPAVASSTETEPKSKAKKKKNKKKKTAAATAEGHERMAPVQDNVDAEMPMDIGEHMNDETLDRKTREFYEENQRLREARTCKVCMDFEVNTVFLPCGHLVCCDRCSPELRNCPICRTYIRGTVKTFLS